MKHLILSIVAVFAIAGCCLGCAPVEGFVNGGFAGKGADNILHQMEIIVKNAMIVYDPTMTEEDFEAWVAKHEYNRRRFVSLFKLYATLVPPTDHDVGAMVSMNKAMIKSGKELDRAQGDFYRENDE